MVAFSGKRQFQELFASGGGAGGRGRQKKAAGAAAGGSPLGSPQQAVEAAADAAAGAEAPPPAAAAGGEQPSGHADGSSSSSAAGGSSASGERLPVLQARRPAIIATGRQWVLPEGWPLPLTTEVRQLARVVRFLCGHVPYFGRAPRIFSCAAVGLQAACSPAEELAVANPLPLRTWKPRVQGFLS